MSHDRPLLPERLKARPEISFIPRPAPGFIAWFLNTRSHDCRAELRESLISDFRSLPSAVHAGSQWRLRQQFDQRTGIGHSPAQFFPNWIVVNPAVICIIPATSNPRHGKTTC
jgi:hypothetical protein